MFAQSCLPVNKHNIILPSASSDKLLLLLLLLSLRLALVFVSLSFGARSPLSDPLLGALVAFGVTS